MDHAANPDPGQEAAIDAAIQSYQAGQLDAAEAQCRSILLQDKQASDALNLLAMIACDRSDASAALAYLAEPTASGRAGPAIHNTHARALAALGRWAEAEAAYRLAWSQNPGLAAIANNLACLLRDRGRLAEAVDWFRTARTLLPGAAEVARNLADTLAAQHRHAEALAVYQEALQLDPAAADTHANCAAMLLACGKAADAEAMLRTALRLRPGSAAWLNNLGLALRAQGQNNEAMAWFDAAIRRDAGFADAHYNRGCLHLLANRLDEARVAHDRALAADERHGLAMWGRCMAELPVLYGTQGEIVGQRARYAEQLGLLEQRARHPVAARALAATAGASQPFFLPYQGRCDRNLQARYGQLMARLLARPTPDLATPPAPGERIRLGIVSGFFREHTIWRLMLKGWLSQIDCARFDVTAYHTGTAEDRQTAVAKALCPRFVTGSAESVRAAIVADRPHVLLYPEIGIDRVAARLGAERLAPVQCVAWGQPQTTGLPAMDIFLSSTLMEPDGAEAHYTEQLAALPGIGVHYQPDERVADRCTRAELGLRDSAAVFWCGQALYKYLPQHDAILARIAARLDDCQFLFIGFAEDPAVTGFFLARLRAAFAGQGLDASRHIRMLPPMTQERFLGTVQLADIVLDSLEWSGGKSTLDMLAQAPVIVTRPGKMMRSRHTAAILTAIDVTDTIAGTDEDYCDIAVALARSPEARADLRRRITALRHRILADKAPIRAMEAVFTGALARQAHPAAAGSLPLQASQQLLGIHLTRLQHGV